MGGNKSFFSLLGLWETLGGLGSFWSIKINLGRLWETLGDSGGAFGEALGGFGEALGGFGDARRPPPNKKTTIYKNVGSTQTPDKPALLAQC